MHGVTPATLYHERNPRASIDIKKSPMVYVNLPSEGVAQQIQARSVLIKEFINVISTSKGSYDDLIKNVDQQSLKQVIDLKLKFRFILEGIGKKISETRKREIVEMFKDMPFEEKYVSLKDYELVYKILDNEGDEMIYFGNVVASCRVDDFREDTFYAKYSLKLRPYLGPTSTDHDLAFLMANQGQVREGDFVYDPFVGTGSIAAALQHFKAFVFGSDLDIRVIKGYGVGRKTKNDIKDLDKIERFDIFTNFKYYKIPVPDFWVQDANHPMIRKSQIFDSIVCDPPYGVRAKTQTVGKSDHKANKQAEKGIDPSQKQIPDQNQPDASFHSTMCKQYAVQQIYYDILDNASKMLRAGGRIVFLYHTDDTLSDEENKFPEHEAFQQVCSSKDKLTKHRSRHLITYKKY